MSLWRKDREPVTAEFPIVPRDVVDVELGPARDSALLDLTGRLRAGLAEIDALMSAELERGRDGRDVRLFNALLEVRHKLAPGSQVLPLRSSVPVIPGRTS